jgi:hypothetical protein
MTFNTGNNVPSTDPRDLYDNAENLDKLVNGADPFYADRKGVLRESWAGMENSFNNAQEGRETAFTQSQADKESRFQAFLVSSGYVSKGDYAANVVLEERNEYVAVDAATTGTTAGLYRPGPGATLPLTLTGTWATDKASLTLLGDDVLRQELANGTSFLVDGEVVSGLILPINSLAELRSRVGRYDGDVVYLRGRTESGTLGAGQFKWDAASTLADDDGVVIGSAATGRWIRIGTNFECHGEWFGVDNDGADYTTQLQNAINYAATVVGGAQGMRVQLPKGKIGISDTIVQPNLVAIHGANGRGTIIEALDTFNPAATEMLNANNGTSSMFGSRLVDLWFNMRGKGASTGRCIHTVAMQETCGLERVLLMGFNRYGLEYSNGYGGAAYLPLKDIEIFAGSEGTTPTAGIQINQVSSVGGFVLSVDGCTIAGSPPGSATPYQLPAGIRLANDTFVGRGLHFEACQDCVVSLGIGSISIDTITGSSNGVVDSLVTLGSSWTGTLSVQNSITNGAANHVRNNANAAVIPSVAGMQPLITHPDKAQSAPLAWVVFDASATAVGGQCAILAKSANISRVVKTAVGRFSVQYAYSQPTGKSRSAGGGITNLNNNDPIKIVHTGGSASAEFIEVRRKVSDTTWGDYDPQRIGLQFFGDRL